MLHARCRRRKDGRQHEDEAPRSSACTGRQRRRQPCGRTVGSNFHICGEAPDALGQPGARRRSADGKRNRRLTDAEYDALSGALRKAAATNIWPPAIAVARFLAVTGWRSGEALALRWHDVDLVRRTATLDDTKTGRSVRPLSDAACDVLRSLARSGHLVFPATRGSGDLVMSGFKKLWKRIAKLGGLPPDVSPHVLRHSFASLAADLGYSEPVIAALVGHQGRSTTSRYLHSADAVLLAAADTVANHTAQLMGEGPPGAQVIPLLRGGAA